MRRWFTRLPIHRKLVVVALAVTAAALIVATVGLMAVDIVRYRTAARDDTASLARLIAENSAAAVVFGDPDAARMTLATVRVRPNVARACLYLADGSLFAGYARSSESACQATPPARLPWNVVLGTAGISSNSGLVGTVYVERDLAEIWTRVAVAGLAGFAMLLLAGTLALALANRLHSSVSAPIAALASAARSLRPDDGAMNLPALEASEDEVGDLVRAFGGMVSRVRDANTRLLESNARLRRQEAEREELLVREREASRLKDEFLAAVSHELRTPLNAIAGWVQILTTTAADEETTARAIASIGRNVQAQARVINDLVDVSRIVTGKVALTFEPIDLREVVESATDTLRPSAQAGQVELEVRTPRAPAVVRGDRDRLQQVVWNLLSNALKFTPEGGHVTVALEARDAAYDLSVRDTGIGIPQPFVPHVFDRFRQADGSITRRHGGLGLGLAIVKELAELHGGTVSAESDGPGTGATFRVRLPALAGAVKAATRTGRAALPDLSRVRILAVDDNADALEVLATALGLSGATVGVASSGRDALEQWDRAPGDILICDLAMPGMDGFQVLREIRKRDAPGRSTPAIALTAHSSAEYQARTREAGFDAHVSKPFGMPDLLDAIVTVLEGA